jgi:hypothetical protein
MFRWVLLIVAIACLYWAYQRGLQRGDPFPTQSSAGQPAPTLEPGGRPGGGLNPFVMGAEGGGPPQRPQVPAIPGRR